jgi:geranylgeranyl reductase family protein
MGRFDAIVVGAGPAGSTAARELAAAGARVLVLDAAEFPRYKACGGGIPLRTEHLLPFPIDSVVEASVDTLEVRWFGRMGFTRRSPGPFARMVMRDRFDNLLLEQARAAGAAFRGRTRVRTLAGGRPVRVEADGFAAEADFLVCADGAHSPVGAMAGLGKGLVECAAWEVEVCAPPSLLQRYRSTTVIELGYRPWGYGWVFPKADVLSTGIVLPKGLGNRLRPELERFLGRAGLARAPVAMARGHKIRLRRGGEPIAAGNVLLAGDAAGLADEFTQEGIYYAIQSGRLAARSILGAMSGNGQLEPYQDAIDREVTPELHAARLVAFMFYGMLRRFPRAWMFATNHVGYLWDAFFAIQQGQSTYTREVARTPVLPALAERLLHD